MYEKGEGCTQDIPKALELYQKSSAQGYALAQFTLGIYTLY